MSSSLGVKKCQARLRSPRGSGVHHASQPAPRRKYFVRAPNGPARARLHSPACSGAWRSLRVEASPPACCSSSVGIASTSASDDAARRCPASPGPPRLPHRQRTIVGPKAAKRPSSALERPLRPCQCGSEKGQCHATSGCAAALAALVSCRLRLSVAAPESQAATAIAQRTALFGALVRLQAARGTRGSFDCFHAESA
jgi:hypothetical protein